MRDRGVTDDAQTKEGLAGAGQEFLSKCAMDTLSYTEKS